MENADLIAQLEADGARVAAVVDTSDPAAPVPTCPGWTLRDLVHHLGGVHRWATGFVQGDHGQPREGDLEELSGGWPSDADLPTWFRAGHAGLVLALRSAPDDLATWTFLEASTPLAFWARRQAHETAIHRVDAEGAVGGVAPFPATFAADGIDEVLLRFVARGGRPLPVDRERVLTIAATDLDRRWSVTFAPAGFRTAEGAAHGGESDIRGSASDLYVWLWNRSSPDRLELTGSEELLELWRDHARITWG